MERCVRAADTRLWSLLTRDAVGQTAVREAALASRDGGAPLGRPGTEVNWRMPKRRRLADQISPNVRHVADPNLRFAGFCMHNQTLALLFALSAHQPSLANDNGPQTVPCEYRMGGQEVSSTCSIVVGSLSRTNIRTPVMPMTLPALPTVMKTSNGQPFSSLFMVM